MANITENENLKRRKLLSSVHAPLPTIQPTLANLIGHIPPAAKGSLPGDMEDAYGSPVDNIATTDNSRMIRLPHDLLVRAGIGCEGGQDALLFLRPRCLTQVLFMCRDVLEHGFVGHIFGQPGTGKSTTALYVATQFVKDKRWCVLWAHMVVATPDSFWVCMLMNPDGSVSTFHVTDSGLGGVMDDLGNDDHDTTAGILVILDGVKFDEHMTKVPARIWFAENPSKRRLILISSDGSDKGISGSERSQKSIRIFRQWSWTLAEYENATANEEFWNHIESFLDSPDAPNLPEVHLSDHARRLRNKFYFAGGSARWMFGTLTEEVKGDINGALRKGLRLGQFDSDVMSRLFSRFPIRKSHIVSEYAKQEMSETMGIADLRIWRRHPILAECDNGAQEELFQLFVYFETLERTARGEGITMHDRGGTELELRFESVVRKRIPVLNRGECPQSTLIWPYSTDQPAFDALYISGDTIVFLQVTMGQKRAVNLMKLRNTMTQLEIERCEIYFIIPMNMMASFRIGSIQNTDALTDFGWPSDEAGIKNKMRVCGVEGWGPR